MAPRHRVPRPAAAAAAAPLLLFVGAALPGGCWGDATGCTLMALVLRYQDSPLDLEPPFEPYIETYQAKLDWSYEAFSMDARPDTGCEVENVPPKPTTVPIGGSAKVTLFARHPESGNKRQYTVTASRLLGSETELRSLAVEGGALSPIFSERHREYTVRLDLSRDVVRVVYGLKDSEQRITASAQSERPSALDEGTRRGGKGKKEGRGSSRQDADGGGEQDSGEEAADRRLGDSRALAAPRPGALAALSEVSGEAQFRTASFDFLLDVGFSRTLQLTVQCADPTQASIGTYTLYVSRPECNPERPYFSPERSSCVNFCSSGYYRNRETHRCSKCNDNCKICSGLLECRMCLPDTAEFTYAIQPDGKCRAVANHLFKRYRWWCVGLGALLAFLVLIGCLAACQVCCCGRGGKRRRYARDADWDTDEDSPRYHRQGRLAQY